jgi:Lrp/AsnC family leucine-responsive transcriptional regulator
VQPGDKAHFYPFIASVPNVLECVSVTGDYSMLIKVCFHTTEELDAFVGSLQRFGKTYTQIVFSTPVPPRGPRVRPTGVKSEGTEE